MLYHPVKVLSMSSTLSLDFSSAHCAVVWTIESFYFINGSAGHHSLLEEHISSKFSPNFFAVLCNSALASGDKCLSDRCLDKRSPPLYSWMGIFPHQYKSIWSLSGRDTILQNSICGANAESYSCLKIPGLCNVTFAIVRIPAPPPLESRNRLILEIQSF